MLEYALMRREEIIGEFCLKHNINEKEFILFRYYLDRIGLFILINEKNDTIIAEENIISFKENKTARKEPMRRSFTPEEFKVLMETEKNITKALIFGNG